MSNKYNTPIALFLGLILCYLGSGCNNNEQQSGQANEAINQDLLDSLKAKKVLLANGWSLTPAGNSIELGDLPLNLVSSPSGKYIAVTNNGQSTHSIMLIDPTSETLLSENEIPKAWYGLKFSQDEKRIYASGGNDNMIRIYDINQDQLAYADSIVLGKPWIGRNNPSKIGPTGIDIDFDQNILYTVTKEDSSLYICDLTNNSVKQKVKLAHEAYTCLLSPDKQKLYVSLWGGEKVAIYDVANGVVSKMIAVESHPNEMVLTKDGKYLYVANANSNSVSVIDTQQQKVVETIVASLYPEAPTGSTTNGLAFSEDEEKLFIANADNNCLAVFDIEERGQSRSLGFIPTGWYPTSVKVLGDKILVANGKGEFPKANPNGPNPYVRRDEKTEYIARLFKGTLSFINVPEAIDLAAYSQLVYDNTPYNKEIEAQADGEEGNPIPRKVGDESPIKYVFYVIKENRTYDQIFGDMPEGNGDSSLCLFPEIVTPNHHALARNFTLFDNFYVDAEVSADGHNWTTAAYATDYTEKTWPTSYGGRGGTYDYEGSRRIAYPEKGYIWDHCARSGVSYRSYGEFVWDGKSGLKSLEGHIDVDFPSYNLSIMDTFRIHKWKHDFDSLLALDAVPRFSTIRIGNDHTVGARVGGKTPKACVADNDLALGHLVEHISNSSIWNESAIFILEDDAQNGPDHVDAHRSVLLVASPYTRRGFVDKTMYSTASVLRTMELILGIPPMSQYDAAATPLYRSFVVQQDLTPYTALLNTHPLDELNEEHNEISKLSEQFNLEVEDAAPDIAFNEVIWKAVRGLDSEMPAPRRGAFVKVVEDDDEEEEALRKPESDR
ncbi:MAG: bifunctional YncE family protein/alkaline phosphatase family protein [Bacteroidota bacterium]